MKLHPGSVKTTCKKGQMPPNIKSFVLFLSDDFRANKLSNFGNQFLRHIYHQSNSNKHTGKCGSRGGTGGPDPPPPGKSCYMGFYRE